MSKLARIGNLKLVPSFIICVITLLLSSLSFADSETLVEQRPDIQRFIDYMATQYHLNSTELTQWFNSLPTIPRTSPQAKTRPIIVHMKEKHDFIPWYQYRKFFINENRVNLGVDYWHKNQKWLNKANKVYGVPQSIIIATIGVESKYGQEMGGFEVFDSLAVLAFDYSHRQEFFLQQLAAFLLYCQQNGIDPLSVRGSYAGAIGQPQFMPTSIRLYAVDFDHSGKIDILHNSADAIGSVANFYHGNHWHHGEPIASLAVEKGNSAAQLLKRDSAPKMSIAAFAKLGITTKDHVPSTLEATLISLEGKKEPQYWLVFHNFYVIKNYNQSTDYAMALYHLSLLIKAKLNHELATEKTVQAKKKTEHSVKKQHKKVQVTH